MKTFEVYELGKVSKDEKGYYVELEKKYMDALINIEGFSHLTIIWWANEFDNEEARAYTKSVKPYKNGPEELGLFATRSPVRPNPICTSIVQVMFIEENKIYIPYIDAYEGTPVLDIKPYHMCSDRLKDVTVPKWCSHWPKYYEDSAHFNWEDEFENAQ